MIDQMNLNKLYHLDIPPSSRDCKLAIRASPSLNGKIKVLFYTNKA